MIVERIGGVALAYPGKLRPAIVVKASRETLVLVAAACGLTFALAYGIHSRPPPAPVATSEPVVPQDWTGGLIDVTAAKPLPTTTEPMTSAALTVPKSALALPTVPKPPVARGRACEGANCPAKIAALPVPAARHETAADKAAAVPREKEAGLMTRLNPLNHVPDIVRKPFAYAGDAVSGWFKSF